MSEFLTEVLAAVSAPVEKEVTLHGKTGKVFFRRITAGERQQILKGQKVSRTSGGSTSFELDLALNEEQRQKLVLFSVCKSDGSPYFSDIKAVQKAEHEVVEALYNVAQSLDDEAATDDLGKG